MPEEVVTERLVSKKSKRPAFLEGLAVDLLEDGVATEGVVVEGTVAVPANRQSQE